MAEGELRLTRCRHGLMLHGVNDQFIGRSLALYGEFAELELHAFKSLLKPGQVAIDAGANIGTHAVFLAKTLGPTGGVVAFEPQRIIYQRLCANVALNGHNNVWTIQAGLGREAGHLMVPSIDYSKTGNFGGLELRDDGPGERVPITTIDALSLPRCDFIKIDVEGMELAVVEGASRTIAERRPRLYIENNRREKSVALIQALFDLDYRLFWHTPYLFNPDNHFGNQENVFEGIWTANMLCLPREGGFSARLQEITSADDWWKKD